MGGLRRTTRRPRRAPQELALSLQLRPPDAAVRRRAGGASTALVGDQALIDQVFASVDSCAAACGCCDDDGLDVRPPAPRPARVRGSAPQRDGDAVRRPARSDADAPSSPSAAATTRPREALRARGLSASGRRRRLARAGATSRASRTSATRWRSSSGSGGDPGRRRPRRSVARLGRAPQLAAVHPRRVGAAAAWSMFTEDGGYDVVESVERVAARPAGLRPQRRAHAQLRRRRARHPQLDLRLPRRRHQEHPQLRGRLPGRPRRQARAELPLDADDPRPPPTRSSPTTAGGWRRRCGPRSARATRSRSAS